MNARTVMDAVLAGYYSGTSGYYSRTSGALAGYYSGTSGVPFRPATLNARTVTDAVLVTVALFLRSVTTRALAVERA